MPVRPDTRSGTAASAPITKPLSRVEWWGLALFAIGSVATLVGGFYWLFRRLSEIPAVGPTFPSPFAFLLIGFGAGLPFSLPGALFAWKEQRPEKVAAKERKAKNLQHIQRLQYPMNCLRVALPRRNLSRCSAQNSLGTDRKLPIWYRYQYTG